MLDSSSPVHRYLSLPLSASVYDLNAAFQASSDAQASDIDVLAQHILDDLKVTFVDNAPSRLSKQAAVVVALPKLKDLGKSPQVAELLATPSNLRRLLDISTSSEVKGLTENNALRCIANTCLLIESARVTFVSTDVNGGEICLALLQRTSSMESIYLASRILFLCTASIFSAAAFIRWMVENKRSNDPGSETPIGVLSAKMDELLHLITAGKSVGGTSPVDAMIDLLKLIFNLCSHYPKLTDNETQTAEIGASGSSQIIMGDLWSPRLDGLLPPLLRTFHGLRASSPHPLVPPMLHVIHSLITIPVNPTTGTMWFGPQPSTLLSHAILTDSTNPSSSISPHPEICAPTPAKESKSRVVLDRALSVFATSRRSFSLSSTSRSPTPPVPDTAIRACELLDVTLASYFDGSHDPDAEEVRNRFRDHPLGDYTMSDIIVPLVLLLTRFCLGDEDAKLRIRKWFVPENLDRTKPLEEQDSALGRCLRLLQSVYHDRLGSCVGEMFFAMYDSNPLNLTTLGYGNFAGFLFNKGLATGPPTNTSVEPLTTSSGVPIDPITGTVVKPHEPDGMTNEEKEREAEKLFVLFDRLERMGAIPPSQNPIRKAMERESK